MLSIKILFTELYKMIQMLPNYTYNKPHNIKMRLLK